MIYLNKSDITDSVTLNSDRNITANTIGFFIEKQTTGIVSEIIPDDYTIKDCGYTIVLDLDMDSITPGSYICQVEANGTVVAMEELILEDDVTETSSSYDGVKILD